MVIWLFGISGCGKTTLGRRLKSYCDERGLNTCLIDGDIVRSFFDNDLGYTIEDRQANIKRIILATYLLNESNVIPIVCNISPFEELREFSRKKIKDYNLIYLKRSLDECERNDIKSVYKKSRKTETTVGIEICFDEPQNIDLLLETGKETIDESFGKLLGYLKNKYKVFS